MTDNYIIKGIGGFYYVKSGDEILECKAKGIFRKKKITPLAGDKVFLETENGANIISEILPRKNFFIRPPIANVDLMIIVASTVQPVPSTLVIDKLCAIATDKGAEPILVITKIDILAAQALAECYKKSGIKVIQANAETNEGIAEIKQLLNSRLSVFTGNSGVGKSTLINALLPQLSLETGDISKKLGRGRHTTREVTIYEAHGGYIADTPGFASLEMESVASIPKENLQFAFKEIEPYISKCKFTGCSHTCEKGCAVIEAVNKGDITQSRYESYITMYNQAKEIKDWQR